MQSSTMAKAHFVARVLYGRRRASLGYTTREPRVSPACLSILTSWHSSLTGPLCSPTLSTLAPT